MIVFATAPDLDVHLAASATRPVVVAATPSPHPWVGHRVRSGDTLIGLAARYRTTPGEIAARNGIGDPRTLRAGTTIEVPAPTRAAQWPTPGSGARQTGAAAASWYTVQPGDTLTGVAMRHRMTLPALIKANRLSPHALIHPGQRLRVGPSRARPAGKQAHARRSHAAPVGGRVASTRTVFPGRSAAPWHSTDLRRNRALLATATIPDRLTTRAIIVATARAHGVDHRLALAVAMQESGWNQRAVSGANAIGVMQVIPDGAAWAETLTGRKLNLLDTKDNITAGIVMLRGLTRMTESRDEAIAAYYQGLGSVRSRGWYADTHRYVANVTALRARM